MKAPFKHPNQLSTLYGFPDSITEYMKRHHAVINISVESSACLNGYGQRADTMLELKLPYRKCQRCGYHSLWNPNDDNSHCVRHTYTKGFDTVFAYDPDKCNLSLEQAFCEWLSKQPQITSQPVKELLCIRPMLSKETKELANDDTETET